MHTHPWKFFSPHHCSNYFNHMHGGAGHADAAGRGGRRGPPPGAPFGFGPPGGPGFPWNFFRRGAPRARRGDVRLAILLLLAEQPRNGYQIMQELEQRSQGTWRPSPGSVYPALQQLEDEGLIAAENKLFTLTEAGKKHVAEHAGELPPWEEFADAAGDDVMGLMQLIRDAGAAAIQVVHHGDKKQITQARKVLLQTRRDLYKILSEDESADEP
jgi:DNA-binding PadR family transcriptional regulator